MISIKSGIHILLTLFSFGGSNQIVIPVLWEITNLPGVSDAAHRIPLLEADAKTSKAHSLREYFCKVNRTFIINALHSNRTETNFSSQLTRVLIVVSHLIVSVTQFLIVIGPPRAYLSRNRRARSRGCPITGIQIWTFCNWMLTLFSRQLRAL